MINKDKNRIRHILSVLYVILMPLVLPAQNLPVLPSDAAVVQGVAPNGMTYYVIGNASAKGMADFALVQRTGWTTAGDSLYIKVVDVAKDALASLPRLTSRSPQTFLTSHGVNPGKDGFVKVTENATVFLFDNVMLSQNATVLDSTLLVMMDIVDRASYATDPFVKEWYTPADHALIVAGDVNAKTVVEKVRYMSMMTPSGNALPRRGYEWKDCDTLTFVCEPDPVHDLATVSAVWRMARTPHEYMNTVQPAIYEMFVGELGMMAADRIRHALRKKGIPCASVDYDHVNSLESLYDESFRVSVSVAPDNAVEAASVLSAVMSSLDRGQATVEELQKVRSRYLDMMQEEDRKPLKRNSDYVDRCVSAFLYNATLASQKEKLAFHSSRNLPDTTELRLFNGIASAMLDPVRNFTLHYSNGLSCSDSLLVKDAFDAAWNNPPDNSEPLALSYESGVSLPGMTEKVKVKSSQEHMTKGEIWTFPNGFKVIYHRMPSYGNLYYAMALKAGYSSLQDIQAGEGAFLSDYLPLCRIAGLSGQDFGHYLESEGITMDTKVNLSSTVVSGYAPQNRAETLIRVLLATFNDRVHDVDEFAYYVESQKLVKEKMKGTIYDRLSFLDKVLCPEYDYTIYRNAEVLTEETGVKADAFFTGLSGKMNDGVLVLVGDMDPLQLKKMLTMYAGAFRTTDRAFARPHVYYRTVSGWTTYMMEGDVNSVDIVMSVQMPLTIDNRMAATVASMVLKQALASAIVDTGMYLSLSSSFDIYPQERFSVMISLNEADPDGFASNVELGGPLSALETVRDALSDLSETPVSKSDMAAFKTLLTESTRQRLADPQYWVDALVMRYVDGKDFTTGYDSKIGAVSEDQVRSILTSLNDGAKVECTIRRK